MVKYIRNNIVPSLGSSPLLNLKYSIIVLLVYGPIAFAIGTFGKVFKDDIVDSKNLFILPFTMIIFPCFLEEGFFRGLLIPRSVLDQSFGKKATAILISAVLFVLWHPLNALIFTVIARPFFYNFYFLAIVFILGLACGIGYVVSRSLWIPIIIHWLTVVTWVLFLGGRVLVKDI